MRTAAALAALALLAGCPIHRQRNAPGIIDVKVPPEDIATEEVEPPRDPGEHVVLVSIGGFGAVGARAGDGSSHLAAEAGVEMGFQWGDLEKSHDRGMLLLPIVLPERRKGINVGWIAYEPSEDDSDKAELGPLYVEYAESERAWGWAVGYGYDPEDDSHGPHVSANGFGYYGKASYRLGRGFDAVIGVVLKIPESIVWSR